MVLPIPSSTSTSGAYVVGGTSMTQHEAISKVCPLARLVTFSGSSSECTAVEWPCLCLISWIW